MRILIVSPGYIPVTSKKGAIEKLIEYYLDYNEIVKDDITLYTIKSRETETRTFKHTQFKIIDKTTLLFKTKDYFYRLLNKLTKKNLPGAYMRSVVKDLNKHKNINSYDCIIFENCQYHIPYFKKHTGAKNKIILHLHNDYVNKDTINIQEIIASCDEIWPVSEFIKSRIEEVNHKKIPIKVLYNGVNFANFQKKLSQQEKLSFKKSLNIMDETVFLYTGRLMPEKGVKELVEAFLVVNQQFPKTKLLIAGGTKSMRATDSYRESLLSLSKDNQNIIFTGYVEYQSMYKYYQIADIQVVPSICNEAFGLVLLEGLPSNLTVIATKSGGIPEVLKDDAIYVNRENLVEDLVAKMTQVLKEEREIKDYKAIIEKFSIENYCQNFHEFIK